MEYRIQKLNAQELERSISQVEALLDILRFRFCISCGYKDACVSDCKTTNITKAQSKQGWQVQVAQLLSMCFSVNSVAPIQANQSTPFAPTLPNQPAQSDLERWIQTTLSVLHDTERFDVE